MLSWKVSSLLEIPLKTSSLPEALHLESGQLQSTANRVIPPAFSCCVKIKTCGWSPTPDRFFRFAFFPLHAAPSTLMFSTSSLLLSTDAARLAAVGCVVLAYEAARRERQPRAAPVCPPPAALLLGLSERQHPKPSGPHPSSSAPTEPGSSSHGAPPRGAPSPSRPGQCQQQWEPSLHGLPEHGGPFSALGASPEE